MESPDVRKQTAGARGRGLAAMLTLVCLLLLMQWSLPVLAEDTPASAPKAEAPLPKDKDLELEIKLGKEAADQIEKDKTVKLVKDEAILKHIQEIGGKIAEHAKTMTVPATYGNCKAANFDYQFKVIDDPVVNAFSLPGGHIYVNTGLIKYVQSDDELAGVIAHEVAHVAHHHGLEQVKADNRQMMSLAAAVLIGAALGAGLEDTLPLASLIRTAKMSAYGQQAEADADRTSVAFMVGTAYNPVGMLTFMERLARDDSRKPTINLGIFANHPPSHQRARDIIGELDERGITINRRLVTTYMRVEVKPVNDSEASSVWLMNIELVKLADSGGEKAAARAEGVADALGEQLLAGATIRDVKVSQDGRCVVVRGESLVQPSAEDAALAGTSVEKVAAQTAASLKKALFSEHLQQNYSSQEYVK